MAQTLRHEGGRRRGGWSRATAAVHIDGYTNHTHTLTLWHNILSNTLTHTLSQVHTRTDAHTHTHTHTLTRTHKQLSCTTVII